MEKSLPSQGISYCDAGVDINVGNALVERIKPAIKQTHRAGVIGNIGGFGGFFELPTGFRWPVLVSGTDGVGTKLKLAIAQSKHDTIGIDLVAMCVNDIVVTGAAPLYFLDYYATSALEIDVATQVIEGIATGCKQAGIALIGGETAEMPGMYQADDYDLAGFAVGIVEKDRIIDGSRISDGDAIIGLSSSGPHANGYSLIRKIMQHHNIDYNQPFEGQRLGKVLLEPTRIYVKALLSMLRVVDARAMAHITGGGLSENIPRVLPAGYTAVIDKKSWQRPAIFDWLQERGNISEPELLRTFNNGVGMVVVVAQSDLERSLEQLEQTGENAFCIGHIKSSGTPESSPCVEFVS